MLKKSIGFWQVFPAQRSQNSVKSHEFITAFAGFLELDIPISIGRHQSMIPEKPAVFEGVHRIVFVKHQLSSFAHKTVSFLGGKSLSWGLTWGSSTLIFRNIFHHFSTSRDSLLSQSNPPSATFHVFHGINPRFHLRNGEAFHVLFLGEICWIYPRSFLQREGLGWKKSSWWWHFQGGGWSIQMNRFSQFWCVFLRLSG